MFVHPTLRALTPMLGTGVTGENVQEADSWPLPTLRLSQHRDKQCLAANQITLDGRPDHGPSSVPVLGAD